MKEDLKVLSENEKNILDSVFKVFEKAVEKEPEPEKEGVTWFDGKKINEVEFCDYFMRKHPIKYAMNNFYDKDGMLSREKLEQEVLNEIKPYVTSGLARKISSLIDALIINARSDDIPIREDRVNFANGTLFLDDMRFTEDKEICFNRLPVNYNKDAIKPKKWLEFLSDLLYEEDIKTLQEFMGYVLIPTTRAQAMLLVIGNGGEGKSRVALVLKEILGDNMNVCPLDKLAKDKFCRADQEGKLLMVDDDMKMEAMTETNIIKSVVTMEGAMDLERKGKQSVQGVLYVRIICFGNGSLTSLYDKSDGFYRRQIVLRTKERPADRKDDRLLIEKLKAEKEGIVRWCIEGLNELRKNDFHFTISERAKKNLEETKKEDDNFIEFFESEGYIRLEENTHAGSKDLYIAYSMWCRDNLEKPRSEKSFSKYIKANAEKMGLTYEKNLDIGYGKKVRGYHGIHVKVRTEMPMSCF